MGFDPVTVGLILTAAGTAVGAVSSLEQGRAQKKMAQYNAAVARQSADAAVEAAAHEELRTREEAKRLRGRMMALYGKSGVTMEGSPLEVMEEAAAQEEIDIWTIRRTGATSASQHRSQAQLSAMKGESAHKAGIYGAGTSLLHGAGAYMKAKGKPTLNTTS